MVISNAKFLLGAVEESKFPILNLPEIAFIGRSNVGKSSLINSVVMRKKLAKTSSSPGKTREINFFIVEEKWVLVDMPGLGYATIGKKARERFATLNYIYLEKRDGLKLVCALIDSRHDPMEKDIELLEFLENTERNFLIVLTKCDKISNQAIIDRREQLQHLVSQCEHCVDVLPYSSVTDLGRNEMLGIINKTSKQK